MNQLIKINNKTSELDATLKVLQADLGVEFHEEGYPIQFNLDKSKGLSISIENDGIAYVISASQTPYLMNALTRMVQHHQEEDSLLSLDYQAAFSKNGVMVDCSRNAVMNTKTVKKMLRKMALLGHTWFSLYIEDTYEIDGEPYFGAYRGRYSQADLKELDDYAYELGIELYPSIQTLAHVNQFLQWEHESYKYADIDDILNVGRETTFELVRKMIQTLSKCFRSNRIHLGMDEAYNLGRGSYLTEFGLKDKADIMLEYLDHLLEICEEYDVKPTIWDDMFFSNYSNIEGEDNFEIPKQIDLMYWDYYNLSEDHYLERINMRREIAEEVIFAGGAWRWTGYTPHHLKTLHSSIAAIKACKALDVDKVIATAWGDDGSEAPFSVVLFGATLYSYLNFNEGYNEEQFNEYLKLHTGLSLSDWLNQGKFDFLEHFTIEDYVDVTPSKYFLYQDLLMPLFMDKISSMSVDYGEVMKELQQYFSILEDGDSLTNQFFSAYAYTLELKWNLPLLIWEAYHENHYDDLKKIANEQLPELKRRLELLLKARQSLWLDECNVMGFEIIEQRFGGMMVRCDSVAERLQSYLDGSISKIDELEEQRLDPSPHEKHQHLEAMNYNRALRIMSRSRATW